MVLRDNVVCVTSDGMVIKLSEMTVDMRKGHVLSQKPVDVVQRAGHITANELEVVDNGAVVQFRGRVRYTASPQQPETATAPRQGATADATPPRAAAQ